MSTAEQVEVRELQQEKSRLQAEVDNLLAMKKHVQGELRAMEKNRDRARAEYKEAKRGEQ